MRNMCQLGIFIIYLLTRTPPNFFFFFFKDRPPPEISPLPLPAPLPISLARRGRPPVLVGVPEPRPADRQCAPPGPLSARPFGAPRDHLRPGGPAVGRERARPSRSRRPEIGRAHV